MKETEVVIMFADLSGFTALTEAHGDLDAARLVDRYEALARSALAEGARVVKRSGTR